MFKREDLPPCEDSQALGQAAWKDCPVSILEEVFEAEIKA